MIIDNALSNSVILGDGLKKKLKLLKSATRRFVFNEDASHKQGRFVADCVDIICRKAEDIVKPFPNTYIEIDNFAGIRGAGGKPSEYSASERIAFWWTESGQCFIIAGDNHQAEFQPFIYAEHGSDAGLTLRDHYMSIRDAAEEDGGRFLKTYEMFKQHLMIGGVREELRPEVDKYRKNLTNRYDIGISAVPGMPNEALDFYFRENIGTYKVALSCLLLLDERVQRQLVHVKASQRIIKGKLRGFPKHDMVTIDLDVPSIRKVYDSHGGGHHDTAYEHDVAGHWTHHNVSSQCEHIWKPYRSEKAENKDLKRGHAEPLKREACALCGGQRTRKPPFIRGDANKGSTVGKRGYRVIASREKGR